MTGRIRNTYLGLKKSEAKKEEMTREQRELTCVTRMSDAWDVNRMAKKCEGGRDGRRWRGVQGTSGVDDVSFKSG